MHIGQAICDICAYCIMYVVYDTVYTYTHNNAGRRLLKYCGKFSFVCVAAQAKDFSPSIPSIWHRQSYTRTQCPNVSSTSYSWCKVQSRTVATTPPHPLASATATPPNHRRDDSGSTWCLDSWSISFKFIQFIQWVMKSSIHSMGDEKLKKELKEVKPYMHVNDFWFCP